MKARIVKEYKLGIWFIHWKKIH